MKISVVIATYNGENYITKQLTSLRTQKRKPDEVLIYDDHSTDSTAAEVRSYIAKHGLTGWNVIVNHTNKGWRRTFMEGLWASSGEIVFTCDQDDIWRSDKLQIMEKLMQQNNNIKLLASNYRKFLSVPGDNPRKSIGPLKNTKQLIKIPVTNNYLKVTCPGCTYCIRRSLITLSKKYWRPGYAHDDLLWRLSLLGDGLYVYTDNLINWRKHPDSAYAKESSSLKTIAKKADWIIMTAQFNNDMLTYLQEDVATKSVRKLHILHRNKKWLFLRTKFFKNRNFFTGLHLLSYINCYQRLRQYLGDWYLLFLKRR
ncbi:glycosyltransferase [Liquorilactobacillus oeni]|uniref:Glycosyltransferase 2-like domain-containing protein n=1 Tax=Liquorilactobacillus oeni DSM 19972 TaxID=1423777 RepID=A0A0R1MDD0_9LACO|nr:glycosyltransferase [Liquorilactobacillus oeni]KRL05801.1 hypothetical protein FD46_GL000557 [Liquorilactobacillus oeni DSM 19972]